MCAHRHSQSFRETKHSIYFLIKNNAIVLSRKVPYCAAYYCKGHVVTCRWRLGLILFIKPGIIPALLPPRTFILQFALFNIFCCAVIFTVPLTLCYKWPYTRPLCRGEMYASMWQVSLNYRIDGGTHTLRVAALSLLNVREQIENVSIHADLHDVLSIKLHIYCLIFLK